MASTAINTWYNCIVTWNGSTWLIYLNGTLATTYTGGMNGSGSLDNLNFGYSNAGNCSIGNGTYGIYTGEVRNYNRVLSADQIALIGTGAGAGAGAG